MWHSGVEWLQPQLGVHVLKFGSGQLTQCILTRCNRVVSDACVCVCVYVCVCVCVVVAADSGERGALHAWWFVARVCIHCMYSTSAEYSSFRQQIAIAGATLQCEHDFTAVFTAV